MKSQEKKPASRSQKTTKSPKEKSLNKPKAKEQTVKHKEKPPKDTDAELELPFRLHLFDVNDNLLSNKFLGRMTKSEAEKLMEQFIIKKDTAVSGKLIRTK